MSEQPFSIICVSSQDWHAMLPTNRQHVMLRASRRGHQVLFVETGYFVGRDLRALLRGPDRWSLARRLISAEDVMPGVLLRRALNILPWGSKFRLSKAVNTALTARRVRAVAAELSRPVVLWIYDPGAVGLVGGCGEDFAVYDCVDDYAAYTTSGRRQDLVAMCDRLAAQRSGLVFATATPIYERHRRLNSATHLVRNAGDYEHFAGAVDRAAASTEVSDLPRPVLGFAGNLVSSKVDFDLLEDVALALPESTLLLIGPAGAGTASVLEALSRLPNVKWLGPKPYSTLPQYVAAFDVGLIPYVSNAYTNSCFPLKTYEYLAAGKPVVASGLPELSAMEPDVVLADGAATFIHAIEIALGRNSVAERLRRQQFAASNSWEAKTDRLLRLVQRELETTGSSA
jgi:glycosyltransferase involved in cell wall biosynthesis